MRSRPWSDLEERLAEPRARYDALMARPDTESRTSWSTGAGAPAQSPGRCSTVSHVDGATTNSVIPNGLCCREIG